MGGKQPVFAVRVEKTSGQRSVNLLEKLEEHQADAVAIGEKAIASGTRKFLYEALRRQFRHFVAHRSKGKLLGGRPSVGLALQARRSAVSIAANITEGSPGAASWRSRTF